MCLSWLLTDFEITALFPEYQKPLEVLTRTRFWQVNADTLTVNETFSHSFLPSSGDR